MPSSTISFTGHRPAKLGHGNPYSAVQYARIQLFAEDYIARLAPGTSIISGLALGWDTAVALAAVSLGYRLIAAIPCPQQPFRWPARDIQAWAWIKRKAAEVHVLAPAYTPECMQARNEWMVDRGDRLVALWNGSPGGTANCIRYAQQKGKPVENLWSLWKEQH